MENCNCRNRNRNRGLMELGAASVVLEALHTYIVLLNIGLYEVDTWRSHGSVDAVG